MFVMKIMLDQTVLLGLDLASILVILARDLMRVIAPTASPTPHSLKMEKPASVMTTGQVLAARTI